MRSLLGCVLTFLVALDVHTAHEHDRLVVGGRLLHVGVHEAFGMKLAEHEQLPRRVVADHARVVVDLAVPAQDVIFALR